MNLENNSEALRIEAICERASSVECSLGDIDGNEDTMRKWFLINKNKTMIKHMEQNSSERVIVWQ